jgi:hypothetical protein
MKLTHCIATACSLALGLALACDLEKEDSDPRQGAVDDEDGEEEGGIPMEEGEASSESGGDEHECEDDDVGMTTGEVPPPSTDDPYAFAMRYGDLPSIPGESDSGGGSDGEPFQDDNALVVNIASAAQTCADPYAALPCGGHFSIGFILPPDLQAPGTYQLWEETFAHSTYAAPPYPEGDCAWGGGSLSGFVEIEAIDDQHVAGRLFETDAWDFDANIEFDAEICS